MSPVTFFSEWWSGLTIERPPVRAVAPPQDPEPRPAHADAVVFGPGRRATPNYGDLLLRCAWCDVKWAYGAGLACWCCGRPG